MWALLGFLPERGTYSSTWMVFALALLQILVAGLAFRAWFGPFILKHISQRVQVRRVSFRSIRGLYIRTSSLSVRVDRIGLSFHPSPQASRRFGLKVEGLHVEVHELKTKSRPAAASRRRRFSRLPSLAELAPASVAEQALSSLQSLLDAAFRPIFRVFFITFARLAIKCLPTLTQVVDFELEKAVVTFRSDPEVHLTVNEMVLSTTVSFSKVESVVDVVDTISEQPSRRVFSRMSTIRSRLQDSTRRVLGRAWGNTQGSASFSLKAEKVAAVLSCEKMPSVKDREGARSYAELTVPNEGNSTSFELPGWSELDVSFRFGPSKQIIEDRSVCVQMKLPSFTCFTSSMKTFMHGIASLKVDENRSLSDEEQERHNLQPRLTSIQLPQRCRDSEPGVFSKFNFLRLVEFSVKSISFTHALPEKTGLISPITFLARIQGVQTAVEFGEPKKRNCLHKEHLASRADDEEEFGTIMSSSFSIKGITIHRRDIEVRPSLLRIVSIGGTSFDFITSNWLPIGRRPRVFLDDVNSPFVALKLTVTAPQLSERLDVLMNILDGLRVNKSRDEAKQTSDSQVLHNVPRVHLEVAVEDIAACVRPGDQCHDDASALILSSTQFTLTTSSYFRSFCLAKSNALKRDCIPQDVLISFRCVLGPAFVMSVASPLLSNGPDACSSDSNNAHGGDPILSLTSIEVGGSAQALCGQVIDEAMASVDLSSLMADFHCVAEAASIELWQPLSIVLLRNLLASLKSSTSTTGNPEESDLTLFDAFPRGITAHFAIGEFALILTGKDINPKEDLDLSRGIGVKAGFSLQICTLDRREQYSRLPKRFPQARDRNQLLLFEGLTTEAIAITTSLKHAPEKLVLLRSSFWNVSVRSAAATEYATDHPYDLEDVREIAELEFLWIKRLDISFLYSHLDPREAGNGQKRLQLSARIPYIRSHFQLFNAYCVLLALETLRSLSGGKSKPKSMGSKTRMAITMRASIHTVQVLLNLPLDESVCIRVDNLILRSHEPAEFQADYGTLFVWVQAGRADGKWEELLRLRQWKSTIRDAETSPMEIKIDCDGARFRIPHRYILADLILNINIFLKGVKHLRTITSEGRFQDIGTPDVEGAKCVPSIALKVGCISLEASDDPFESTLGLIHRVGAEASRIRAEREDAFEEKVNAIETAGEEDGEDEDKRFNPQHTVSVDEAYQRLLMVHSISWCSLIRDSKELQRKVEDGIRKKVHGNYFHYSGLDVPPLVPLSPPEHFTPLFRIIASRFDVSISRPHFHDDKLVDFLYDLGDGLPRYTQFSLLIPLHLNFAIGATCVTLRDYPLPVLNILQDSPDSPTAWVVDGDFVIAEEIGTVSAVAWKDCIVVPAGSGVSGSAEMVLSVPKTTMPVKTYTSLTANVVTEQVTEFCWAVSYAPAIQDVMRILDTISTPPPDPSPALGFWDKLKLILHWKVMINFSSEVRLNLKGSRNPHTIEGDGSGFSFCWDGDTCLTVGHANKDRELMQVKSDRLFLVIPKFGKAKSEVTLGGIVPRAAHGPVSLNPGLEGRRGDFFKICAKFNSGIKFGIGFALERTCGTSCRTCGDRSACRIFDFRPHYDVRLVPKLQTPRENSPDDSFTGFRSSFIHMSISLTSNDSRGSEAASSIFHLTPKAFAHFWSWWGLFDRSLSLPVRLGKLFPIARPSSKKFGQHLATLKYRFSVDNLYISHVYKDETRKSWAEGVSHCVGLKAFAKHFEADLHQREEEFTAAGSEPGTQKKAQHKSFYAIEVKLAEIRLRAMFAAFNEPSRSLIDFGEDVEETFYKDIKPEEEGTEAQSAWFNLDDFVETDWRPPGIEPAFYSMQVASCPRFTYFKRAGENRGRSEGEGLNGHSGKSRFGNEDTHVCLIGRETSVHQTQSELVEQRISELMRQLTGLRQALETHPSKLEQWTHRINDIERKIRQLERHVRQLHEGDEPNSQNDGSEGFANYLMPSDIVCPDDWVEFDNVYQAHCPKFSLTNSSRNLLTQYYYCSRARRGLEYHLATRAVKFIRDQAEAHSRTSTETFESRRRTRRPTDIAAQALKKILAVGDDDSDSNDPIYDEPEEDLPHFDPMSGWSKDDVSLNKSHFCLLLKPQVILRSDASKDSVLVLACVQASLQSFTISDTAHIEDPVSGRIMTRTIADLSGLQTFTPTPFCPSRHDGIPLEILLDLRAESKEFERLVPQTDATFRYDKFNRLRLRNNVSSVTEQSEDNPNSHLQHQTDLFDITMPRFSVSANSKDFESIANVITNLLLKSDSAHKMHASKVETLLFSYDFTDLYAAAVVVEGLQSRLRHAIEQKRFLESQIEEGDEQGQLEILRLGAHIFLLAEELNFIFDAIQLAQQKQDDKYEDSKLALKVHASSNEISWGMVDSSSELITKLAVRGIDYTWLNRQDGSIVNNLVLKDLQVFDGSPDAEWPEILSKYREPSNHPLVKRGLFALADWTVLAPVGGIAIYERFIVNLHPMRLQLEAKVGKRIMEYVWPARQHRKSIESVRKDAGQTTSSPIQRTTSVDTGRVSLDSHPAAKYGRVSSEEPRRQNLGLPSKRLTSSRSFNDLRSASRQQSTYLSTADPSTSDLSSFKNDNRPSQVRRESSNVLAFTSRQRSRDDAIEMKSRSAQKTFVLVQVSSMHILLSFNKDGSFFCRDAKIQTRELQYRNQTWSFEELADQFIPSDTSWRGWMRMALHQPLIPVLPVAKELFSKTKWLASKSKPAREAKRIVSAHPQEGSERGSNERPRISSDSHVSHRKLKKARKPGDNTNLLLDMDT